MSVFKCKMCGGTIEFNPGDTVGVCDSCGTKQTLPRLDDEKRANLYDRANHFRRNNEFDKAAGIYEQILNEDGSDAEAYWSLVLCRYGIEYVEDAATKKRVPTVNRAQYTSVFDDDNYKSALKYADGHQKAIYEEEAKAINDIQKGILEISQKEEPFDVFICYKENDSAGRRTPDSVLANDLYHQLTREGFKVFFARITLEDKLGTAYEPYIFAALNSAKVMVVLGTKPEYFNAVWVKNEWSRYLSLIKNGADKMLVPAYKDMDPYDLPEEFSHLQAQDMSKLGFMQDLIRGIKKIVNGGKSAKSTNREAAVPSSNSNTEPLLKRAFIFLEDGDFKSADEYCEKVLDINPECAEAYLGKLMAELNVKKRGKLRDVEFPFDTYDNYKKIMRFGDENLKAQLQKDIEFINERNKNNILKIATEEISNQHYEEALDLLNEISGYKNADELILNCKEEINKIKIAKEEQDRQYKDKLEKKRKMKKKIVLIIISVFVVAFAAILATKTVQHIKLVKKFNTVSVGEYIEFGEYEQYKTSNGKEPIEWLVIDKTDDKVLLISKYVLDCKPYNSIKTNVTWETCSLRKWLNGTFMDSAFNGVEKSIVKKTNVSADKNPKYSTNPGNATTDKVFLLSISEVNKYFGSNEDRKCVPTEYAKANGAYTSSSYTKNGVPTNPWWLRSPGDYQNSAAAVNVGGEVWGFGPDVNFDQTGVRPAMWLSTK